MTSKDSVGDGPSRQMEASSDVLPLVNDNSDNSVDEVGRLKSTLQAANGSRRQREQSRSAPPEARGAQSQPSGQVPVSLQPQPVQIQYDPVPTPMNPATPVGKQVSPPTSDFPMEESNAAESVKLPDPDSLEKPKADQSNGNSSDAAGRSAAPDSKDESEEGSATDDKHWSEKSAFSIQNASQIIGRQDYLTAQNRLQKSIEECQAALYKLKESLPQKQPRSIARLEQQLLAADSDDLSEILRRIKTLGKSKSPAAVEVIRLKVDSNQKGIRLECARSLGRISHASCYITLLELLQDSSPDVVEESLRSLLKSNYLKEGCSAVLAIALVNIRFRAVLFDSLSLLSEESTDVLRSHLLENIDSRDSELVTLIIALLSRVGADNLTRRLLGLARDDREIIRASAIEALSLTKENQVVRYLNAAMKDQSLCVRASAATGLAKIRSPRSTELLIHALSDSEVLVRRAAAKTLSGIDDSGAASAASQAIRSETDPATVERLLEIIGKEGTNDALDALHSYLQSDERELRHRALATIRRLKNPRSAQQVLALVDKSDVDTRKLAVESLGRLGNMKVCSRLRDLLKNDVDELVRAASARALGDLKDADSITALEEALHDGVNVRCQAVIALGNLGDKSSIAALMAQLKDNAPEVRYQACNALGQIGDKSCVKLLTDMLEDKDAMVRRGAENALEKLGVKKSGMSQIRNVRRLFRRYAGNILPNVAAGGVPLSTVGVGLIALLLCGGLGYGVYKAIGIFSSSGGAFTGPVSYVASVAVNSDGSRIAVLRDRNVIESWSMADGALTSRFQIEDRTSRVMFSDNSHVLLSTAEGLIKWAVDKDPYGQSIESLAVDEVSTVQRMIVLPDGKTAYLFTGKNVNVLDLEGHTLLRSFKIPVLVPGSMTVSPDQQILIYGDKEGWIRILSAKDGKEQQKFSVTDFLQLGPKAKAIVENLSYSHDGKYLAISFSSGHLQIWDMHEGELFKSHKVNFSVSKMAFHPSTYDLIFVNNEGVQVLNNEFANIDLIDGSDMGDPFAIQLSADGATMVAFVDEEYDVWVIDLESRAVKYQLKGNAG